MEKKGNRYRVRGPIEDRDGLPLPELPEEYLLSSKARAMSILNGRASNRMTTEQAERLRQIDLQQFPQKSAAELRAEAAKNKEERLIRMHGSAESAAKAKLNHILRESRRLAPEATTSSSALTPPT